MSNNLCSGLVFIANVSNVYGLFGKPQLLAIDLPVTVSTVRAYRLCTTAADTMRKCRSAHYLLRTQMLTYVFRVVA